MASPGASPLSSCKANEMVTLLVILWAVTGVLALWIIVTWPKEMRKYSLRTRCSVVVPFWKGWAAEVQPADVAVLKAFRWRVILACSGTLAIALGQTIWIRIEAARLAAAVEDEHARNLAVTKAMRQRAEERLRNAPTVPRDAADFSAPDGSQ